MFNMGRGPDAQVAELEQLARRYWDTWREALQRTMPGAGDWSAGAASAMPGMAGSSSAPGGADPWREAMRWWAPGAAPSQPGMEALGQFQAMAGPWLERIAQVATQFAGRDASPQAIASAWRDAMGANPLGQMFAQMQGEGVEGWGAWVQRLRPWLEGANGSGGRDAYSLPTFGLMREHQERWQQSARAFSGYQQSQQGFQSLLMQASNDAFGIFERKLRDRDPATPIETPRALFDLWIDAAEEGYAEVALSPAFRTAYAEMVAGQMRLRQAVQREIEQACRALDLPTRTELDGAHRKIADLERALRRLRDRLDALDDAQGRPVAASSEPPRRRAGPTVVVDTPAGDVAAKPTRKPRKTPAAKRARRPAASAPAAPPAKKAAARKRPAAGTGATRSPAKRVAKKAVSKTANTRAAGAASGRTAARQRPAKPGFAAKRATKTRPSGRAAKRPARESARPPSRAGGLPNQGFISPIPQAPAPLQDKRGKPRKGKR